MLYVPDPDSSCHMQANEALFTVMGYTADGQVVQPLFETQLLDLARRYTNFRAVLRKETTPTGLRSKCPDLPAAAHIPDQAQKPT